MRLRIQNTTNSAMIIKKLHAGLKKKHPSRASLRLEIRPRGSGVFTQRGYPLGDSSLFYMCVAER